MEDNWKGTREALTSTCQEVLGRKKYHHKEWISIEILTKIQEKKNKRIATAFSASVGLNMRKGRSKIQHNQTWWRISR
ncbi:unnamed protein product [Schistosoma margrebowiei]|uniref:Uncharacterized protein n=1 Tax=Schistosoma margrebowiei TaxID=48269 RepID=A0A183MUX5_9TREM|nr:unnamed protein product [Schistosoma margrebowiei]